MKRIAKKKLKNKKTTDVSNKLIPTKFALAAAIIVATITFLITLIAITPEFSRISIIISLIYSNIGYTTSITGAFLGATYTFIDTFILAWLFAWLYNKLL